jgi:hypothetical protein
MRKWLFIVPGLCLLILGPAVVVGYRNGAGGAPAPAVQPSPKPLFNVDLIAGQTPAGVDAVLGAPIASEQVSPSNTPCPCPKVVYRGGIEVVYINGRADWLTVNLPPEQVQAAGRYVSVDRFPSYTYIKVASP